MNEKCGLDSIWITAQQPNHHFRFGLRFRLVSTVAVGATVSRCSVEVLVEIAVEIDSMAFMIGNAILTPHPILHAQHMIVSPMS